MTTTFKSFLVVLLTVGWIAQPAARAFATPGIQAPALRPANFQTEALVSMAVGAARYFVEGTDHQNDGFRRLIGILRTASTLALGAALWIAPIRPLHAQSSAASEPPRKSLVITLNHGNLPSMSFSGNFGPLNIDPDFWRTYTLPSPNFSLAARQYFSPVIKDSPFRLSMDFGIVGFLDSNPTGKRLKNIFELFDGDMKHGGLSIGINIPLGGLQNFPWTIFKPRSPSETRTVPHAKSLPSVNPAALHRLPTSA